MCGLNGIYAYHDAASEPREAELVATREHMAARGPDGYGAWWSTDRRICLGHRRLSVLDLSERAAQPMASADGRLVVVFNGEIYNAPGLRTELQARGCTFRTTSDTELLLHLYAREGRSMVSRLRGMFAFAIWDAAARELFLARDLYGIKPLYYANDGWTFRFASQVKALLAGGGVSSDPEPAGIVGFQLWGSVPEPFSLYRDIRGLPAGHTMRVDRWGPREPERYASVTGILAGVDGPTPDPAERRQTIAEGVRDSVRAHLLSDVEVGVFLSAGVDSGSVLALAREAGLARPKAITLAFPEFLGTSDDEAPLAAEVARRYGAEHVVRRVDEAEFEADLPAMFSAMDQPSIDGINAWFVAKAALKVALSGLGGDELLGGYPSFTDLPRWRRRYGPVSRLPGAGRTARLLLQTFASGLARSRPKAPYVLEYAGSLEGAYMLRRGLFLPGELAALLEPDLVNEGLRRLEPLGRLRQTLSPDPGSDIARLCALESGHYMRDQLLRDADWAGMAHGVEIRTPLADRVLLERLARAIHGLDGNEGKRALALSPRVPLPCTVVERAKSGFVVPTVQWMASVLEGDPVRTGAQGSRGLVSRRWSQKVLAEVGGGLHGAREDPAPVASAA